MTLERRETLDSIPAREPADEALAMLPNA